MSLNNPPLDEVIPTGLKPNREKDLTAPNLFSFESFLVSVVIPVYNESAGIEKLMEALDSALNLYPRKEVIFVDDGSTDSTLSVLEIVKRKYTYIKTISFKKNLGQQKAMEVGLTKCSGDFCILIDADLQDPPALIPILIDRWIQGAKIVSTYRQSRKSIPAWKKLGYFIFYRLMNFLGHNSIYPGSGDFCLYDREAIQQMLQFKETQKIFRVLRLKIPMRHEMIPFAAPARHIGKSKYTFLKLARLALSSFRVAGLLNRFYVLCFSLLMASLISVFLINTTAVKIAGFVFFLFFLTLHFLFIYDYRKYRTELSVKDYQEYILSSDLA